MSTKVIVLVRMTILCLKIVYVPHLRRTVNQRKGPKLVFFAKVTIGQIDVPS